MVGWVLGFNTWVGSIISILQIQNTEAGSDSIDFYILLLIQNTEAVRLIIRAWKHFATKTQTWFRYFISFKT